MHLVGFFYVLCGCSTMSWDEVGSVDVVFVSYQLDFATFCRSKDLESSSPLSVVILALTWSGRKSGSWLLK